MLYLDNLSKIDILENDEQKIGIFGISITSQGRPDNESFLVSTIKIPLILFALFFK